MKQADLLIRHYASLLFFGPLVRARISKIHINDLQRRQLYHTLRRWYGVTGAGVLLVAIGLISQLVDVARLSLVFYGVLIGIGVLIAWGLRSIHHGHESDHHASYSFNTQLLLSYIPWYNRYQRYTSRHDLPYRWLKESVLWRYLIMVGFVLGGSTIVGHLILAAMILRVLLLSFGVDIIPNTIKKSLNWLYHDHPDEIPDRGLDILADRGHLSLSHESVSRDPRTRNVVDRISYSLAILIVGGIIMTGISIRRDSIIMPGPLRGVALLVVYITIRWTYSVIGPVPIIHTLVGSIYARVRQHYFSRSSDTWTSSS
jgi:hypothetical protein